jgi:hypothetical protein
LLLRAEATPRPLTRSAVVNDPVSTLLSPAPLRAAATANPLLVALSAPAGSTKASALSAMGRTALSKMMCGVREA